jgi:hypothetical protein
LVLHFPEVVLIIGNFLVTFSSLLFATTLCFISLKFGEGIATQKRLFYLLMLGKKPQAYLLH